MSTIDQTHSERPNIILLTFLEIRRLPEVESQRWYGLYSIAIFEFAPRKLALLLEATEEAIQGRLQDLHNESAHHEERHLISDAQRTLLLLRQDL